MTQPETMAMFNPDTNEIESGVLEPQAPVGVDEKIVFEDYFTYDEVKRWYFPDGKQYIEYQPMTEGDRRKYQSKTMTQMTMNRNSGDSKVGINVARDRAALLDISVKDWFMVRNGVQVPFKDRQFGWEKWVTIANPKLIESLERAIRKDNPWMQTEMTSEECRAEIDRLEELYVELKEKEKGESDSSNK